MAFPEPIFKLKHVILFVTDNALLVIVSVTVNPLLFIYASCILSIWKLCLLLTGTY